jgi:hypothetical protein
MRSEFWKKNHHGEKYTRTQAYNDFPHLKADIEKEIKNFKKSNSLSMKLSYDDGLEVWIERTLDEVKNANKEFQTKTEQIEGCKKKKVIQELCN